MLKSLTLGHFTVFEQATFEFGQHLNVIIGENGTGKSHLLKVLYSVLAARAAPKAPQGPVAFTARMNEKLLAVFRAEKLANLARRDGPPSQTRLTVTSVDTPAIDLCLEIGESAASVRLLSEWHEPAPGEKSLPVFLPPKELLSTFAGFSSLYSTTEIPFEETWNDTCLLLGKPLPKTAQSKLVKALERLLGGSVLLENERFYLQTTHEKFEMHLVAEGLRKLAMIARLRANRSLRKGVVLFWDEPESNLNPRLIKEVARVILRLGKMGVQVFITTHSLFLLREIEMLLPKEFSALDARFFGLQKSSTGVVVEQGHAPADMGTIVLLDEELSQSDRFLEEG